MMRRFAGALLLIVSTLGFASSDAFAQARCAGDTVLSPPAGASPHSGHDQIPPPEQTPPESGHDPECPHESSTVPCVANACASVSATTAYRATPGFPVCERPIFAGAHRLTSRISSPEPPPPKS